jgi:tetratricopeptide (TPR) repeat protein
VGLSTQDFIAAYRALSTRACPTSGIRKALRLQASRVEKGRRLTLAESLVESHAVSPFTGGELASTAAVDLRADPAALREAGDLFLSTETASELELDRIVDALMKPADPKTLKETPVPAGLTGYDLAWEVGRSRTGSVYRGTRRGTGQAVAIKVFRKEAFASDAERRAFLEALSAPPPESGPDTVKVVEVQDVDGHAVVIKEFIEGVPMDRLLADRKVSMRRGVEIVGRAAALLAPMHAKGISHGRLSARAIFVQANDRPKVELSDRPAGAKPQDDVDALGAVLYEVAAGAPPYGGFRSHELKAPSRHNPACAGDVEKIVLKALARDPARRYPDAGALAEDIERYLRHEPVTADVALSEAAPPSPIGDPRSRRWAWKLGAAAAVLLVAVGVISWIRSRPDKPSGPGPGPAPVVSSPRGEPVPPEVTPPPKRPPPPKEDARLKQLAAKGPLSTKEDLNFQFKAAELLASRSFDELDRLGEEALIRGPEAGWAHYHRAFVALERGKDDDALRHADRALAIGIPSMTLLYELRLDIRLARAEYKAALEELARLYPKEQGVSLPNQEILRLDREIEKDPAYAAAFIRRGAIYLHRRQARRAIEDFSRAVTAGESRADYFLALAYLEEGRKGDAAEATRRFIAAHESTAGAVEAKAFLASLQ